MFCEYAAFANSCSPASATLLATRSRSKVSPVIVRVRPAPPEPTTYAATVPTPDRVRLSSFLPVFFPDTSPFRGLWSKDAALPSIFSSPAIRHPQCVKLHVEIAFRRGLLQITKDF